MMMDNVIKPMANHSMEDKSIIMRCDKINQAAFLEPEEELDIELYKAGMESLWAAIQKNAGEFAEKSDSEIAAYFLEKFGDERAALEERCFFLKEKASNQYIGTCMAWFGWRSGEKISVLHWLAVDKRYGGKGYARMLITQVLKFFLQKEPGRKIYLHTQPRSYKAIKLYHDFGFCMTQKDTYGTAINEYDAAMDILKKCMREEEYRKLTETSIW